MLRVDPTNLKCNFFYLFSYSACIRRAAGYCCIEYTVCEGVPNAFSLDGSTPASALVETKCKLDYISIPGNFHFYTKYTIILLFSIYANPVIRVIPALR